MYLHYIKYKDSAIAQNGTNYEIYDNTNNIEELLKCKNRIFLLDLKKSEMVQLYNEEERYLKTIYLNFKKNIELGRLKKLESESYKVFSDKKENSYIQNIDFIEDLDNKLKLIDFYLNIRDAIINHKELNISFNDKENQSKKLKFINLCLININNSEDFINSLIEKDNLYSINKQKKLKYDN